MKTQTIRRAAILCAFAVVAAPAALASGHAYLEEVNARLDQLESRYADLADAIPADKYSYRPGEGVRSVSEVMMHVAGANYFVAGAFGMKPPEGVDPRGLEASVTEKEAAMSRMKMSFAHLKSSFESKGAGDMEMPMKMFGMDTTVRGALWRAMEHLSEHLGQMIAYARINGVKPPWSE